MIKSKNYLGDNAIIDGVPYMIYRAEFGPQETNVIGSSINNIQYMIWNYDDNQVKDGENHKIWISLEMSIARSPEFCSDSLMLDESTNTVLEYTAPTNGIWRGCAVGINSNNGAKIYLNNLEYSTNVSLNKWENSCAIFVNKSDKIKIQGKSGSNVSFIFLPKKYLITT